MKRFLALVAIAALACALTACTAQKSVFSDEIDEATGAFTVTADNGAKGSALGSVGGGATIEEGQVLVVSSNLTKGSVTVRLLDAAGDVAVEAKAQGAENQLFGLDAGEYSFGATCEEDGTTGTVIVVAVDEQAYNQAGGDLEKALA